MQNSIQIRLTLIFITLAIGLTILVSLTLIWHNKLTQPEQVIIMQNEVLVTSALIVMALLISSILGYLAVRQLVKPMEKTLYESEQRFQQVISSISDHIYMTEFTKEGKQINLYISPNVETLTGYPLKKFTENWNFWPSKVIHPDDRELATTQVKQFAKNHNSEVEYRLIKADGSIIWVRDSGQVKKDSAKQSLLVFGIVSDITARKQTEEALTQAHNRALEASQFKTQLLANVSHDLRTPLNAILGYAEMLQENVFGDLTEEQQTGISEIMDSTSQLLNFVNNLLGQAQIEAGKLVLNITTFNPQVLLDNVQSLLNVMALTKNVDLTVDIAPDVPETLLGDIHRLQQILFNLVSNSIKFTKKGSVHIHIYCPNKTHWGFIVSDTGCGIAPEKQSQIFDTFWQVDGSVTRGHDGSGLGLSIVKELVTLMGGEIQLTSNTGKGSTFTVTLPLESEE